MGSASFNKWVVPPLVKGDEQKSSFALFWCQLSQNLTSGILQMHQTNGLGSW